MARKTIHPQPTDHEIEDCMDRGYSYEHAVRIVRARNQHNRKRAKQGLAPAATYGRETGKLKRPRPSTRERRIDELNSLSASLFKRFHIDYKFTMIPTGTGIRYNRDEDRAITRTYKRRHIEGSELYMYSEVIYAEELQSDEANTIALDLPFFDESADMIEEPNATVAEPLFCSKKRLGKPLTAEHRAKISASKTGMKYNKNKEDKYRIE